MKKVITLFCCFAVCLFLLPGCISFISDVKHPDKQSQPENLLVKIDVEKNGATLDTLSAIVSKDKLAVSDSFQEKLENDIAAKTFFQFNGDNIRKTSADSYSIDYKISFKVPAAVDAGKNSKSFQYTDIGSASSITIKSGQPMYILETPAYKVKLTITKK
ncbi:MAG: hypothetical protein WCV67_18235 [Victivallaceae bacterium]|jgi:hypothetical protein